MTGWTGKILRSLVIVSVLIWSLALPASGIADEDTGPMYTVKKGDTLWSITTKEFKDPFLWPKLWQRNPQLGNPHLIYPGQEINLEELRRALMEEAAPVEEVVEEVVVEEAPVLPEEPEVPKEATSMNFGAIGEVGFISRDHFKGDGVIFRSKDDKLMVSLNDEVYVEFAAGGTVTLGDIFTVVRETATVRHPINSNKIGYLNDILGTLEITDVKGDYYLARVTMSYQPIEKGDVLSRYRERASLIEYTDGPPGAKGYVVKFDQHALQGAEFRVVFLDLGAKHGMRVGNWMEVYKVPKGTRLLGRVGKMDLAPQVMGDMLVVSVEDETSAAVVHKSTESFEVGDFVRTKQR